MQCGQAAKPGKERDGRVGAPKPDFFFCPNPAREGADPDAQSGRDPGLRAPRGSAIRNLGKVIVSHAPVAVPLLNSEARGVLECPGVIAEAKSVVLTKSAH